MRVGFIGLGRMGLPIATNIVNAGFDLIGFDTAGTDGRTPDGATAADSLAEVVQHADTVLLSVPDAEATLAIVAEVGHVLGRRATVMIDLSTIGPVGARIAADRLASFGIVYADGPVSGGVAGARAGTISLMFSGPDEVLASHRSLFEAFAGNVFHVGGEAGHGQAMKLVNNVLSATAMAASSEALSLGAACGLQMAAMLDVLNVSTGRNSATADKFPNRVLTDSYDTGFLSHLMAKDVALFNDVAGELGTAHHVIDVVGSVWSECDTARPGSDFSEIWKFVSGRP